MATKNKYIDLGGNSIIVNEIRLASKPHRTGTAFLTSTAISLGSLTLTPPTGAATAAGTGSGSAGNTGGAVATNVLPVVINGTTYYIPLCNTNA